MEVTNELLRMNYLDVGKPCPGDLSEMPNNLFNVPIFGITEPWGGKFYIDQADCTVKTETYKGTLKDIYRRSPYYR